MKHKGLFVVCLAVVLVLSLVAACAGPAEGPAPQAPMEPQQWNCLTFEASIETDVEQIWVKAMERIKERTNGLLDIRYLPQGALPIKAEDWLRAISAGDLEMCNIVAGYHAGDYPILGILEIPFIFSSMLEREIVWGAVRPIYQREMAKDNIQLLPLYLIGMHGLCTSKPVDLMDLKGTKIRSYGETVAKLIEAMGGVAVPIAWSEVYTALERGVADGLLTGVGPIYFNKMHEVVPYSYDIGMVGDPDPWAVNKDLWDALPKDVQAIVYEELGVASRINSVYQVTNVEEIWDLMLADVAPKGGHEVAPPEYITMMREHVTTPMLGELMAELGPVGEEIVTAIEEALGIRLH